MTASTLLGYAPSGDRTRNWRVKSRYVSPYHHGSHRALLRPEHRTGDAGAGLDAIVVPTVGPADSLHHAAALADALGCPLVVFCSGRAKASAVAAAVGRDNGPEVLAVDVPDGEHPLLQFTTSAINRAMTGRVVDTGPKRNLGLLLARMVGWQRILFLDDDVTVEGPDDVRRAARLLDRYDSVGLSIGGFPDNSVVCHAHRIGEGWQETFVGGGALTVNVNGALSFFPEIYNEDWFFLLDKTRLRSVAVTGRASQREYDPFAFPARAESEEFGDVLAEGVFWLLDRGQRVKDATAPFWAWFLDQRRLFIRDVARRIRAQAADSARTESILLALKAAQAQRESIRAAECTDYLRAWSADRTRWRNTLDRLPPSLPPAAALHYLGLTSRPAPNLGSA
jgi:hypothetical protein